LLAPACLLTNSLSGLASNAEHIERGRVVIYNPNATLATGDGRHVRMSQAKRADIRAWAQVELEWHFTRLKPLEQSLSAHEHTVHLAAEELALVSSKLSYAASRLMAWNNCRTLSEVEASITGHDHTKTL
jgi:predicted ATP-dependent Lon-type protease